MVTLDSLWLVFIIGTVLPALVALVTKRVASSQVKALVLALLSAVGGTLTSISANGGSFDWMSAVSTTVITFVTAVATHYGLLKPVGVTGTDGIVQRTVTGGVGGRHAAS